YRDMRNKRWNGTMLRVGPISQRRQSCSEQVGDRADPRNRPVGNFTGQVKSLLAQRRDEQGNLCRVWDMGSHLEESTLMINASFPQPLPHHFDILTQIRQG